MYPPAALTAAPTADVLGDPVAFVWAAGRALVEQNPVLLPAGDAATTVQVLAQEVAVAEAGGTCITGTLIEQALHCVVIGTTPLIKPAACPVRGRGVPGRTTSPRSGPSMAQADGSHPRCIPASTYAQQAR